MTKHNTVEAHGKPGLDLQPARVLTLGLGVTVGLWMVWFGLSLPALHLPQAVVVPTVLVAWLAFTMLGARLARPGLPVATLAGVLTALVSLMAFASTLVEQPDPALFADGVVPLKPTAWLFGLGFVVLGGVMGAAGAALAGAASRRPSLPDALDNPWLSRLAAVVAASFVPLVLLGGMVTSTESGMAVRGWPDTFGANMFLYPKSLQSHPRIFLEHSHRLFGTLAGFCTLTLWFVVVLNPSARKRFGAWTTGLLVAVVIQGLVGGYRVVENSPVLGALHGAFGQVVMAFAATLALWMAPRYRDLPSLAGLRTRPLRLLATAALHTSLLQLVLGSIYRHLRRDGNPGASHVLFTHIGLAFVVVTFAILAGAALSRFAREHREQMMSVAARVRGIGTGILVVVGLQFVLGWVALLGVMTADTREGIPTADELAGATAVPLAEAVTATIHQFNGAIYLVLVMLGWAWARRLHRAARAGEA
ncbi:MAG: COX15/CtaA family protein [Planctomycetota bacterium]|nr:COX15/CtaA family protein [Planctomycetota bacterium]